MKTYLCLICGFIYDEADGRPEDGIAPGTRWPMCPPTGNARTAAWPKPSLKRSRFKLRPALVFF